MTTKGSGDVRPALGLFFLTVWASAGPLAAAEWAVDPAQSRLTIEVSQGGAPLQARFETFAAEISFDPAAPEAARAVITVDLTSFTTGDGQRDQIATSREFLDAGGNATATYATAGFVPLGGDRYEVTGTLTLREASRELTHPATIKVDGDAATAEGEVALMRLDYGVGAGQFPRGDQVGLEVIVRYSLKARRAD